MRFSCFFFLACLATLPAFSQKVSLSGEWAFTVAETDAAAASKSDFDAQSWPIVQVPHDWAIAQPFDADASGSTGKLPWQGRGWYRTSFHLDAADRGKRVYLDFDGVMAFPKVYVNGRLAGEWDYGYTPFRVDATDRVLWGEENVVVVEVDTRGWGSRWYPGAGIYRDVSMTVAEQVHLAHWGTRVRTPGTEGRTLIESTIANHSGKALGVTIVHEVIDPSGRVVGQTQEAASMPSWGSIAVEQTLDIDGPQLWDVEHPHLYTVRTMVRSGERVLDRSTTRFGYRTFEFTPDDGFHLNGRRVQLYGVNLHHDLGPLGGAFNRSAARRQLRIMQEMGANAIRTSHNPSARGLIELADEMGLLVFDEVFDKWEWTAGRPDHDPPLPEFGHRHIRNTVLRDRNSPSVVVWSVGNEIGSGEGVEGISPTRVSMMAGFVRAYDDTRPVAMGNHIPGLVNGKNYASLDLTGWNYARRYARYRQVWPDRPIIYSETASTVSTRGYYEPDLAYRPTDYSKSLQVSSYDLTAAPWSDIPDHEFRLLEEDGFLAGEFVWTGFDYLGEPTPFTEQARSSYFGIVDLCGFPKDRYWLYRSHWMPDETTVHILPHWNWPDRVGENVPVFVYTNGDSAELFLNGRSLGTRRKGEVPAREEDLARAGTATASSATESAGSALDPDSPDGWSADASDTARWWQLDLGSVRSIGFVSLDTQLKENLYAYMLEGSRDGTDWVELAAKPTARFPLWEGPSRVGHELDAEARYLRVRFMENRNESPVGLRSFRVYSQRVENEYYDVTYDYRLRWNHVEYEPGQLRAVAYREGTPIGEASVQTAGRASTLEVTSDVSAVSSDADQLAFVTLQAFDADGTPQPLADHLITVAVEGPAEILGVCNGNPLSMAPIQSEQVALFHGKALVVVRPTRGAAGQISVSASGAGLSGGRVTIATDPD